jgi:hypothetical protein
MSFKIPKLVNVNPSSPNGLYQQTLVDGVTTSEGATDAGNIPVLGSNGQLDPSITGGSAQVNSDWNASSGVAEILNKPTIPTPPVLKTNGVVNTSQSTLNLVAGANTTVTSDGTGDVTIASSASPSPLTTKGDLYTRSTSGDARLAVGADGQILTADSTQTDGVKWAASPTTGITALTGDAVASGSGSVTVEVEGIGSVPIDLSGGLPDGVVLQKNNTTGKWEPVLIPVRLASGVPGKPAAGQEALLFVVDLPIVFPANFTGSTGGFGPNGAHPAATATYIVYRNSTQIGTAIISTTGVFTFATTGGSQQTANTGDVISAIAPGTQDASMASVTMTFMAFRGSSVPAYASIPIFVWQGTYSGSVAYATYNLVSYLTNVYICTTTTTTGILPTNTSYWSLFVPAGAAGGAQIAGDLGGTTAAPIVVGLQGKGLDAATVGAPSNNQVIQYDSTSGLYKAKTFLSGATLEINGTLAGSQTLQNLAQGGAITIVDDGVGDITITDMTTPLLSTFSWVNQGTSTAIQNIANGPILMTIADSSSLNWRMLAITQPSTPYKVIAQSRSWVPAYTSSADSGFYFYDGTKLCGFEFLTQSGGCVPRIEHITNVNTDGSTAKAGSQGDGQYFAPLFSPLWVQLRNSGTTLYFDFSFDGIHFTNWYSEAVGSFLTPTKVGWGGISVTNNSANYVLHNLLNWRVVGNANL